MTRWLQKGLPAAFIVVHKPGRNFGFSMPRLNAAGTKVEGAAASRPSGAAPSSYYGTDTTL